MDWRSFGGNKNYEKNNNVSFNNLTTDNLIVKNPYNGLFTISGDLVVKGGTIFYSNIDIKGNNVTISGNTDISGNLNIGGNAIFNKNLTIKGTINLENDVTIGNSLYVTKNVVVHESLYVDGSNVYIGNSNVILTANNRNLGVNVSNPTASIDVSGNTINTLKMSSSNTENVNIISIDCSNDGITVLTDGTKNAIQFWNNTKIPINVNGGLDNANILLNTREDASITYYPKGGNITIDCSNNTYINSNITIGGGASGTATIPHLLNETALIKSSGFGKYLSNYYGVSSSNYQTGNALTLVSGSSVPSNVGLSLVTTDGKGMTVNGGVYIKDSTRSVGTIGVFDVCGATFPIQTAISGNDLRYLKATTGFNTLAPQTEKYALCVNGPVKITNDEIQTIMDVSFQLNCLINSLASPSNIIVAGSAIDIFGNHPILYSKNGGKSWLNSIYKFTLSDTTFLFQNGFVYDSSYSFLTGSNSFAIFSSDENASWNKISTSLTTNFTDVLVLPQSTLNNNLIVLSGISSTGFSGIYCFIVDTLNDMNNISSTNTGFAPAPSKYLTIQNTTPNKIYCMGAISAVNQLGILYVAGSGIKSYTINNNINYTNFQTNPIFPSYGITDYSSIVGNNTYFTMDIFSNFAVFAGTNIITYTSNAYTQITDNGIDYIYGTNFTNYTFVDIIKKIKISSNGGVVAVGDAGTIYYSTDKCVSWSSIIPNNYGMGGILTNPVNMLSSVVMPDENSFLISSVDISYSNTNSITNYGHSKLFYCHWPDLFNHANNNVLDICGNMNITGSALINDGVKINKRLDVLGDVSMNSNFTVSKDATIRGNVSILQNLDVCGNFIVYRNFNVVGVTQYTNITESTSTNTGSVVVSGGIGIAGNLFMGGDLNVANISYLTNTTLSSNSVTGALVVTGGVGVGKNIKIGTQADISGNLSVKGNSFLGNSNNPVNSTSILTGAVVVYGGVGVGGNINIGGNAIVNSVMTISGGVDAVSTTSGGTLTVRGGLGVSGKTYIGGDLAITSTTASTDTNSGSLKISGGMGVTGNIYSGGKLGIGSSEDSFSEITGAVVVNGGVGVGCNIYSGKGVFIKGSDATIDSNVGALQVINGGAWIKGNIITKSNVLVDKNVGIGTTNPSFSLDVNGNCRIQSTNSLFLNNTNNSIYGDISNIYFNVSGGTVSHKFNVTNKTVATINSTGVGIRTTAPLWDLDVSGNGRVTGNLFLDTSSNNYIYSDFSNVYFNVSGGRHKFNVSGVAGGGTVATINSVGVGIRTTAPLWDLDVSGNGRVTGNLFLDTSSNNYIYSDFSNVYFNVSGGRHKFNVSGVAGGGTVATINSVGVGIRTTAPLWDLDVSGNGRVTGNLFLDTSSNNYIYSDFSNVYFNVSGGRHKFNVSGVAGGGTVATINSVGVGIRTTAPLWDLDVSGNGRVTGNLFLDTSSNNYIYSDFSNVYFNVSGGRHKFNVSGVAGGGTVATINSTGVGIGVINPGYSLDVSGTSKFVSKQTYNDSTQPLPSMLIGEQGYVDPGSNGTLSITRSNDTSGAHIALIRAGAGYAQIGYCNGDKLGIWNGTGIKVIPAITISNGFNTTYNVGINNNNPASVLDVSGNARFAKNILINAGSTDNNLYFLSDSTTNTSGNIVSRIFTTGSNLFFDYYSNITFRYASNLSNNTGYTGTQIFFTNTSSVNGSAIIGIGVVPSSYNLDVSGTARFTDNITGNINNSSNTFYVGSGNSFNALSNPKIINGIASGPGDNFNYSTFNVSINSWYGIGFVDTNTNTCRMVINTRAGSLYGIGDISFNGLAKFGDVVIKRLGIGKPSSYANYYELDVTGNAVISGFLSVGDNISTSGTIYTSGSIYSTSGSIYNSKFFAGSNGTSIPAGFTIFTSASTGNLNIMESAGKNYTTISFTESTGLMIQVPQGYGNIYIGNGSNNNSSNIYFQGYGKFAKKITLPEYRCTIDASSSGVYFTSASNYDWRYNNDAGTNYQTMTLDSAGNLVLPYSGGGNVTATAFYATSDYRIKENIVNLKETNYTVDNLRPVHYYNKNTNKEDIGFIAHEVQEDFPFLVSGEKDGKEKQSLNYSGLIGVLVKEIQYLKSENAKQDALIQTLTDNNAKQDALIQTLIQRMDAIEFTNKNS